MTWKKAIRKPIQVRYREANGAYEDIDTPEGRVTADRVRDFIVEGAEGELYPIKKSIFYKTYDLIEETPEPVPVTTVKPSKKTGR